jgi:hypothetical protein
MSLPAKVEGFMGSSGEIISYDRTSLTVKVWARARRHIHTLKGGREGKGGLGRTKAAGALHTAGGGFDGVATCHLCCRRRRRRRPCGDDGAQVKMGRDGSDLALPVEAVGPSGSEWLKKVSTDESSGEHADPPTPAPPKRPTELPPCRQPPLAAPLSSSLFLSLSLSLSLSRALSRILDRL